MLDYLKILLVIPVLVFVYQLYCYMASLKREEKQHVCSNLGIVVFSAGVICLVFRNFYSVMVGLVMIMFGLRLIAYGLERKNKKIFIDRYEEDDTPDK